MDVPFVLAIALFWGAAVLMVWGLKKLEKSQGEKK